MRPFLTRAMLAAFGAFALITVPARAEEGGSGLYLPGAFSSAMDITPTEPGFGIATDVILYSGDFNGQRGLPLGGVLRSGLNADMALWDVAMAYTFEPKVLGASYTVGVSLPFLWVDVEADASVTGPRGRTRSHRISESASGLTDMVIIPLALTWKKDDWKFNFQEVVYAPTGDYEVGSLSNLGKNHWSFDSTVGVSYVGSKTGLEFTLLSGIMFSTENNDTDYKNGNVIHTEATLAQYLPLGKNTLVGIGVNGFYLQQVSGDSGEGAVLGDFEGRTVGLGPVLNVIQTIGDKKLAIQAKWLPELDTKNRLEGNWVWLSVGMAF